MKNKKKVILISCICAVVVIAMAAGAVVLMNRSGKVADEQKAPEATQAPVVTATPEPTRHGAEQSDRRIYYGKSGRKTAICGYYQQY